MWAASYPFRRPAFEAAGVKWEFPVHAIGVGTAIFLHGSLLLFLFDGRHPQPKLAIPAAPVMVEFISAAKSSQEEISPVPVQPAAITKPKRVPKPNRKPRQLEPAGKGPRPIETARSDATAWPSQVPTVPSPVSPAESAPAQAAAPRSVPTAEVLAPPVSPASFNADYLRNPSPRYPSESRSQGEQGRVILRVLVTADGRVERVEIRRSSGYTRLDESARDTVGQWQFTPARQGERSVAAWVLVPISFSLEG